MYILIYSLHILVHIHINTHLCIKSGINPKKYRSHSNWSWTSMAIPEFTTETDHRMASSWERAVVGGVVAKRKETENVLYGLKVMNFSHCCHLVNKYRQPLSISIPEELQGEMLCGSRSSSPTLDVYFKTLCNLQNLEAAQILMRWSRLTLVVRCKPLSS